MTKRSSTMKMLARERRRRTRVTIPDRIICWSGATRDAKAGVPHTTSVPAGGVRGLTPFLAQLEARAARHAELEAVAWREAVSDAALRWEAATRDAAKATHELAALTEQVSGTEPSELQAEELRRLERRLAAAEAQLPALSAVINHRFIDAQLNTSRANEATNQLCALYWTRLRRRHLAADKLSDQPPAIERPAWLNVADGTTVLEDWLRSASLIPSTPTQPAAEENN